MASNGRIFAIVSGCTMIVAFILYIVSNALPEWGSTDIQSTKLTVGLWRVCESNAMGSVCAEVSSECQKYIGDNVAHCKQMMGARAFITIACILSGISVVCLFTYFFITKTDSNPIIMVITKVLPLLSFIAGIIGLALGIAYIVDKPRLTLSSAAFVGIVAVVINMVGAVLTAVVR